MFKTMSRRGGLAAGIAAGLAAALSMASFGACAQDPSVIRIVVPFPAGGVTDQAARILAEKMAAQLGQTVLIDNRPGAGSRVGIAAVAKAPRDGATLLFTNTSYSILPVVEPQLGMDPLKELAPVAMTATYGLGILVGSQVPARTLPEFIDYAKKHPGKLSYGSAGPGSGTHFAGEFFKALTGTFLVHIPYRSTSAALTDVAGGLVDLAFDAAAKPLVDAGKVRLLAVTDAQRDPRFPATPTAAEAGLKRFVLSSWVGLLAPAGTPAATVQRLNQAANAALADPALRRRYQELGLVPGAGAPERFVQQIRDDLALYRKIAAEARLTFE